jgi:hypothetical protein
LSKRRHRVGTANNADGKSKDEIKLCYKLWLCIKSFSANIFEPFRWFTDVGIFTAVLAFIAGLQLTTMNKTDETLRAAQRPWIDIVDTKLANDISFDTNGARITFAFNLVNKGNSPALKINVWDAFFPNQPDETILNFGTPRVGIVDADVKDIIFAGANATRTAASYVWRDVYQKIKPLNGAIHTIWAVVCARYQFSFAVEPHFTCYSFGMYSKTKDHIFSNREPEVPISQNDIMFKYWGASVAN